MKFSFCPECGTPLITKDIGDEGDIPFCESCGKPYIRTPQPCVLVAVYNRKNKIALLRQNYVSNKYWIMVAGYIGEGETAEEAVKREVKEETGLQVESYRYISSFYYEKKDLLLLGFLVFVQDEDFRKSAEVDQIEWFSPQEAEKLLREGSNSYVLFILSREYLNDG
jgi:NAD+ diphosphatase